MFGSRSSSDLVSLRHLLTEARTLHTRPSRPLIFLECGSCFCPRVFVLYALVELFFLVITRCVLALCLLWGLHLTLFNLPQYSCCFSSPSLPFSLLICYSVLAFFLLSFFLYLQFSFSCAGSWSQGLAYPEQAYPHYHFLPIFASVCVSGVHMHICVEARGHPL